MIRLILSFSHLHVALLNSGQKYLLVLFHCTIVLAKKFLFNYIVIVKPVSSPCLGIKKIIFYIIIFFI